MVLLLHLRIPVNSLEFAADENCYYHDCGGGGYVKDGSVLICPQDAKTTKIGTNTRQHCGQTTYLEHGDILLLRTNLL